MRYINNSIITKFLLENISGNINKDNIVWDKANDRYVYKIICRSDERDLYIFKDFSLTLIHTDSFRTIELDKTFENNYLQFVVKQLPKRQSEQYILAVKEHLNRQKEEAKSEFDKHAVAYSKTRRNIDSTIAQLDSMLDESDSESSL